MPLEDIRPIKSELRNRYKALRRNMDSAFKESCDETIAQRVSGLWQYAKNRRLFTYVSTAIEVDTRRIIEKALEDGKTVAVPRCVPGTRTMEFYAISSLQELRPGSFGVLEPEPDPKKLWTDFSEGLCLVPALCYDWKGFEGNMVGLCYSECVRHKLPHGRYDRPVELLVTERFLRRTRPK